MDALLNFLAPANFMPHGHCYLWTPELLWLYVISDGLIALSYFVISFAIFSFIRKRVDLEFNWVFLMFSLFISLCGLTHLISIFTIWTPAYWLDASMKGFTAIASVITAIMLWRLMPVLLTITSVKQLKKTIEQLQYEIEQRKQAESESAHLNNNLEQSIHQRTLELSTMNRDLLMEIEQRKLIEQDLFREKQQAQVTLESIGDGVITADMDAKVTYLNPIAEEMTGWTLAEAKGRPVLEVFRIINETTRQLAPNPIEVVLAHGTVCGIANHTVVISRAGKESAIEDSAAPIINEDGNTIGVVLVFHDVSDARRMAEKMSYLAEHDFLTDLPNRLLLTDRITQALSLAQRKNNRVAILYLDLDHFKKVNDTLGHDVGDQLLILLSKKLQACLRHMDTISRQGGDEFVVMLTEFDSPATPVSIANKLLEATSHPIQIGTHELNVSASIGIALYPEDGDSSDVLMKHADAAMYSAKSLGRNNYQFFTKHLSTKIAEQVDLENSLLRAVNQYEFKLLYQPKILLKTGEIIGAEALIRWQHPQKGFVSPDIFIPIAEDTGQIKLIGKWVLNEACEQNKRWQLAGLPAIPVSINVSAVELKQADYLQQVSKILMQSGLEAQFLELEVTERVAIDGNEEGISDLLALKEMGVKLSIDDFGTGYSSLSYLKRLPVDSVKIDKSFVRDIKIDANDAAIVTAIIKMSHSLNLNVIAEGVETLAQLQFLKEAECDEIQGYFISRPLSAEDFAMLLEANKKYEV